MKLRLCPPSRKPQTKRVERFDVDLLQSKGKREDFEGVHTGLEEGKVGVENEQCRYSQ